MTRPGGDCDIGLIGLAVMGQNLALNIADHGYTIAVYNRTHAVTGEFLSRPDLTTPERIVGCESVEAFVRQLRRPRLVIVLVKAGPAVDAVCRSLLDAGLEPEDIVVDGGNSLWTDTIRREKDYRGKLVFFGSGVSGGELGARFGPSLMPGGDPRAWERLRPIWEAIAAKVDPATGKPILTAEPGRPVTGGEPCTAYIGENGAGHYVKMVHNGIEYADMQLICEAYHLLREALGLTPPELAEVFSEWDRGELDSFLIEITADILRQADPVTGAPLVDVILDRAGQKGTGMWTAANALEMGVPATTITEAVFARGMSAIKDERIAAAKALQGTPALRAGSETAALRAGSETVALRAGSETSGSEGRGTKINPPGSEGRDAAAFISAVRDALYCSKLCAYAQGFQLMAAAQQEYGWTLNFGEIARIWRGGCIIRAIFLQKITEAYQREPNLANLLLDPFFGGRVADLQVAWREVIATATRAGIPVPAFSSALAYYDSYRSERLPASLLQAQRDYFGAHTYERTDQPRGRRFHIDWPHPDRPQTEAD